MSAPDKSDPGRPPSTQAPADRAGWLAMAVVALLGALVLGWAASLSAG